MRAEQWKQRVFGGAAVAALLGAYELGRARADGIPTAPSMFFGGVLEEGGYAVEGTRDLRLRLYDAEATGAGTMRCETTAAGVPVSGGRFRVALASKCTAAVQQRPDLWVEVAVGGAVLGARSKLGAVPYAVEAQRASDLTAAALARVTQPECPLGYARDTTAMGIVLCKRALAGGVFDEVVRVGTGASAFWIDRYEASVWQNTDGSGMQYGAGEGHDDYPATFPRNGQWTAPVHALSRAGVAPSVLLTWFQALEACGASGKRLPTGSEWLRAARGTADPGASPGTGGLCNTMSGGTRLTGGGVLCRSEVGAQDMIGNVTEWTDEWYAGNPQSTPIGFQQNWPSDYNMDGTANLNGAVNAGSVSVSLGVPSVASRGGSWDYGALAGIFGLYLGNGPSNWAVNLGFRCVIPR